MGPADHTEFLGPQIYTLTTGAIDYKTRESIHLQYDLLCVELDVT